MPDLNLRHPLIDALTSEQRATLARYRDGLLEINQRINLVSRSVTPDIFEERHLLHSLTLAARRFPDGAQVADWGTGGGLPGLVLAVLNPGATFHLVDSVGKKVRAVKDLADHLRLDNVLAWHGRAEAYPSAIHISVSRATAPLAKLWAWHKRAATLPALEKEDIAWTDGLICLKGGDLREEIDLAKHRHRGLQVEVTPLDVLGLGSPAFEGKVAVRAWQ